MLTELRVRDLGVIADLTLVLGPAMTALTGETGAGKTLLVEAIALLLGGRADPALVRAGAAEAWVEGRFVVGDCEVVLARAVPATGRSRAYVDGRLATAATLAEAGAGLVDLHGQHAHQSLGAPATQRQALDRFAAIDLAPLRVAIAGVAELDRSMAELGGDTRARAREIDLLRYEVHELDRAAIDGPDEDEHLDRIEDSLAAAQAHREAAGTLVAALRDDGGALDGVRGALGSVQGRAPLAELADRLRGVAVELDDLAREADRLVDQLDDDPERLAAVRARRHALRELRRKYGETLADVVAFHEAAAARLAELEGYEDRARALEHERAAAQRTVVAAAAVVGAARRRAADALALAVEGHLVELAMTGARLAVTVGDEDPGDNVVILLGANAGEPLAPLARAASGGELARAMLALRLVLTDAPPTLLFDEVDAGVGGAAALAVGRALAAVAAEHQVLVVTHLAQVAAFADQQVGVTKREVGGRTETSARLLDDEERFEELSRMLSGLATSDSAQAHARELLAAARQQRGR